MHAASSARGSPARRTTRLRGGGGSVVDLLPTRPCRSDTEPVLHELMALALPFCGRSHGRESVRTLPRVTFLSNLAPSSSQSTLSCMVCVCTNGVAWCMTSEDGSAKGAHSWRRGGRDRAGQKRDFHVRAKKVAPLWHCPFRRKARLPPSTCKQRPHDQDRHRRRPRGRPYWP